MLHLYTVFISQPFLNLLVGIYYILQQIPNIPYADMGIAVILFTIALRIILLPLTLSAQRSEAERRDIEEKVKVLKHDLRAHPIEAAAQIKKLLRGNRRMVISSTIDLTIQVIIALMLWRIFAKGLSGEDLHLLYKFMPHPPQPYDLKFLGIYDLTHPNLSLNLLQSLIIFALETLNVITSPFPVTRGEVIRLQFFLPVVSFMIFSLLPAGKKLFVITTLLFSFGFKLIQVIRHFFFSLFSPPPAQEIVEVPKVG